MSASPYLLPHAQSPAAAGEWDLPWRLDIRRTLAPLRHGRADPTTTTHAGWVWRTAATPEGPASLRLGQHGTRVSATGWGPGATWLVARVPDLLGGRDTPEAFVPRHPTLAGLARRLVGLRLCRTNLVFEALTAAVLEQKVTGSEAHRSWRDLIRWYGSPAPGPAPPGLWVAPPAAVWRAIPSWEWHRAGVDGKRARTVVAAASAAGFLERTLDAPGSALEDLLRRLPGVGEWTAAEIRQRAHGDPDAVSFGDFHVPATVGWALAGRPFDDDQLRAYLMPWAGQRGRVVRLVEAGAARKPRFGPRYAGRDMRRM